MDDERIIPSFSCKDETRSVRCRKMVKIGPVNLLKRDGEHSVSSLGREVRGSKAIDLDRGV